MSKKNNTLTWDIVERMLTNRLDHKANVKAQDINPETNPEPEKKKERTGKVYYRREVKNELKD